MLLWNIPLKRNNAVGGGLCSSNRGNEDGIVRNTLKTKKNVAILVDFYVVGILEKYEKIWIGSLACY
jgi:hypothetical protein